MAETEACHAKMTVLQELANLGRLLAFSLSACRRPQTCRLACVQLASPLRALGIFVHRVQTLGPFSNEDAVSLVNVIQEASSAAEELIACMEVSCTLKWALVVVQHYEDFLNKFGNAARKLGHGFFGVVRNSYKLADALTDNLPAAKAMISEGEEAAAVLVSLTFEPDQALLNLRTKLRDMIASHHSCESLDVNEHDQNEKEFPTSSFNDLVLKFEGFVLGSSRFSDHSDDSDLLELRRKVEAIRQRHHILGDKVPTMFFQPGSDAPAPFPTQLALQPHAAAVTDSGPAEEIPRLTTVCQSLTGLGSPGITPSKMPSRRRSSLSDEAPAEFLCPITCELMSDPVMVVTGQSYERSSIRQWISEGHRTCPVTRLPLSNIDLVPNYALRNAITNWAERRGIKLKEPEYAPPPRSSGATYRSGTQAASTSSNNGEALLWDPSMPERSSPAVLAVSQLYSGNSEDKDAAVAQLCTIASEGGEAGRYLVTQAGAVPPLVVVLEQGSDFSKEMAARCFRFLCRSNNPIITQTCSAAIPGLIKLLSEGTQGAKEASCGALVNLSAKTDVNKFAIAAAGGISPLVAILKGEESNASKMAQECAAAALCNLAFNNENRADIARCGAIPLLVKVMASMPTPEAGEYAAHALGSLACELQENGLAIVEAGAVPVLKSMLQSGSQWSKEAAARTLRNLSFYESLRPTIISAGAVSALLETTETGTARAAESSRAALNNLLGARFRSRQGLPAPGPPVVASRDAETPPVDPPIATGQSNQAAGSSNRMARMYEPLHRIVPSRFVVRSGVRVHPEVQGTAPSGNSANPGSSTGRHAERQGPRIRMPQSGAAPPGQNLPRHAN